MLYTGIDHHRSFSYLTTMNEKGEIIAQEKLPSNGEIVDFLRSFGESMEIAVEAIPSWYWRLCPEFVQVFEDPCGLTALSVLSTCAIPNIIAGMSEEEFVAAIEATNRAQLRRSKLRAIHGIAKASIGIVAGAWSVAFEISFLIEKLELIKRHVAAIERTLIRLVDETEEGEYLLSIRGLNYISVAGSLAVFVGLSD